MHDEQCESSLCAPGGKAVSVCKHRVVGMNWIYSGKCIDVTAGRDENGTAFQIYGCSEANTNQKFNYENGQVIWGDSAGKSSHSHRSNVSRRYLHGSVLHMAPYAL